MKLAVPIALMLILTARAAAQPGAAPPAPAAPPPMTPMTPMMSMPTPPPAAPAADDQRDEGTAVLLSVGGTIASWSVVFAAASVDHGSNGVVPLAAISALFTPGLGHWYAADPSLGWFGLRVAALVPIVYALRACEDDCSGLEVLGYVSLALYGIGTLGDIITAPAAARRYNEEHGALRGLTVAPMLSRNTGGVMLGARF
ncbi:MAG TPA: hypothetical protein VHW23_26460 [Kofleriaceae bacterium]|jgi:hypothetical protein|nr:hypothetical protein [Kofleriaceae bacterium]